MNGMKTADTDNPVYIKMALRLVYEYIKPYAKTDEENVYAYAPDGVVITLPYALDVVRKCADSI